MDIQKFMKDIKNKFHENINKHPDLKQNIIQFANEINKFCNKIEPELDKFIENVKEKFKK